MHLQRGKKTLSVVRVSTGKGKTQGRLEGSVRIAVASKRKKKYELNTKLLYTHNNYKGILLQRIGLREVLHSMKSKSMEEKKKLDCSERT